MALKILTLEPKILVFEAPNTGHRSHKYRPLVLQCYIFGLEDVQTFLKKKSETNTGSNRISRCNFLQIIVFGWSIPSRHTSWTFHLNLFITSTLPSIPFSWAKTHHFSIFHELIFGRKFPRCLWDYWIFLLLNCLGAEALNCWLFEVLRCWIVGLMNC